MTLSMSIEQMVWRENISTPVYLNAIIFFNKQFAVKDSGVSFLTLIIRLVIWLEQYGNENPARKKIGLRLQDFTVCFVDQYKLG